MWYLISKNNYICLSFSCLYNTYVYMKFWISWPFLLEFYIFVCLCLINLFLDNLLDLYVISISIIFLLMGHVESLIIYFYDILIFFFIKTTKMLRWLFYITQLLTVLTEKRIWNQWDPNDKNSVRTIFVFSCLWNVLAKADN